MITLTRTSKPEAKSYLFSIERDGEMSLSLTRMEAIARLTMFEVEDARQLADQAAVSAASAGRSGCCPECGGSIPYRLGHDCQPKIDQPEEIVVGQPEEIVEALRPESSSEARPGKADRVKR
jgi:hypothetical protein